MDAGVVPRNCPPLGTHGPTHRLARPRVAEKASELTMQLVTEPEGRSLNARAARVISEVPGRFWRLPLTLAIRSIRLILLVLSCVPVGYAIGAEPALPGVMAQQAQPSFAF